MTETTPFGTLGDTVAAHLDEEGAVLEPGPLVFRIMARADFLIVLGGVSADHSETLLPDSVRLIAAGGDVAAALAADEYTPQSLAAFSALAEAAAAKALVRHYVMSKGLASGLLPVIADTSFPARSIWNFLPERMSSTPAPSGPGAMPWWSAIRIRVYPLSSGTPALPVRLVPRGESIEAGLGLAALPFLGGPKRISVVVPVRGQAPGLPDGNQRDRTHHGTPGSDPD